MPGRDRTGPEGEGPLTGWGEGDCADYAAPGYGDRMPGRRGVGRWYVGRRAAGRGGRGRGQRWRHWYKATGLPRWARFGPAPAWEPPTPEQEAEALQSQAEWLSGKLEAIKRRLEELNQDA
jgi:hypothetical protein